VTRRADERDEAKKMARRLLADLQRAGASLPPDQLKRIEEMAETGDGDDEPEEGEVAKAQQPPAPTRRPRSRSPVPSQSDGEA
jgi:hypothetical protein